MFGTPYSPHRIALKQALNPPPATATVIDSAAAPTLDTLLLPSAVEEPVQQKAPSIITTAAAPRHHRRNEADADKLNLFYTTNSWALYDNDKADLRNFVRQHRDATSWIVEGHADKRGSIEDNIRLGANRAEGARQFLDALTKGSITTVSYGESRPIVEGDNHKAYQANRRVIVMPSGKNTGNDVITRGLNLLPADAYLIDISSSMNEQGKWNIAQTYKFPVKSQLYTFNDCAGVKRVNSLSGVKPDCGTPLWDSAAEIARQLQAGKNMTVLTDGIDTGSRITREEFIRLANQRNVHVSVVAVGVYSAEEQRMLREVGQQTKGGWYIKNN